MRCLNPDSLIEYLRKREEYSAALIAERERLELLALNLFNNIAVEMFGRYRGVRFEGVAYKIVKGEPYSSIIVSCDDLCGPYSGYYTVTNNEGRFVPFHVTFGGKEKDISWVGNLSPFTGDCGECGRESHASFFPSAARVKYEKAIGCECSNNAKYKQPPLLFPGSIEIIQAISACPDEIVVRHIENGSIAAYPMWDGFVNNYPGFVFNEL